MEIFVDCGLFEVIAVLGLTALARALYSRRLVGVALLVVSVAVPVALLFLVREGPVKWLAAVNLGTALLNGSVALSALRAGGIGSLPIPPSRRYPNAERMAISRSAECATTSPSPVTRRIES